MNRALFRFGQFARHQQRIPSNIFPSRSFGSSVRLRAMGGSSKPPHFDNVAVSVDKGIALVKYNNPKTGNALNTAVIRDISMALKWADENDEVRVIVQTGEGKFYTTGLNLLDQSVPGQGQVIGDEFLEALSNGHKTMINSDKVLIAAVNGPAPGWGTSSLALSDLVYATPEAFFFTPFVQWGLCAEACSSITFASIMGYQKAAGLILAGDRLSAQELESAGLITKILSKESFLDDVMKVAEKISKQPPNTLRMNKNLMMRTRRKQLLEANDVEMEGLRQNGKSEEAWNAIKSFAVEQERKKKEKQKSKL